MNTDRIEKHVLLRTSLKRAWSALSDSTEFGTWFGLRAEAPFSSGAVVRCVIVPTAVDPEVAAKQKRYEGKTFEIAIEQMTTERLFSFRWHPFALEPGVNYSTEPATLVVFTLEEVADGVMLTVVESGFDQIPVARRAKAFAANDGGWSKQMELIEAYLAQAR